MRNVRMYTTRYCPFCIMARELLRRKGVDFDDITLDNNPELRAVMERISGRRTVPQVFINETHVGGYQELAALEHAGQLDSVLNESDSQE